MVQSYSFFEMQPLLNLEEIFAGKETRAVALVDLSLLRYTIVMKCTE